MEVQSLGPRGRFSTNLLGMFFDHNSCLEDSPGALAKTGHYEVGAGAQRGPERSCSPSVGVGSREGRQGISSKTRGAFWGAFFGVWAGVGPNDRCDDRVESPPFVWVGSEFLGCDVVGLELSLHVEVDICAVLFLSSLHIVVFVLS